jgi:hypothetical protein
VTDTKTKEGNNDSYISEHIGGESNDSEWNGSEGNEDNERKVNQNIYKVKNKLNIKSKFFENHS